MEVSVSGPDSLAVEAQVFALAVRDETAPPGDLGRHVRSLLDDDGFEATAGNAVLLHLPAESGAQRVAAGGIAGLVEPIGGAVAWILDESLPLAATEQARAVVDGLILGGYDPGLRKTDGRKDGVHKLVFVGGDDAVQAEAERAVVVARWANRARDLANEPPNDLTPAGLAEHAERIAAESNGRLQAQSFGRERMTELGMGSFLAVSQGSAQEPRTIVLRHDPPDADGDATLGLVGKAVTFDTGGISIKPALYMEDMKGDMSGGAAVLAGLGAVAELGLPVRAIGVVGATENMVGGGAYRPGDIVRAMNGTTIEIVNTDAEGRLVLADVLWYARQQGATHLVDFATLTGAMEKALGDLYAGVFGNDDEWRDRVVDAGNRSGDLAWGLPIHRRFRRYTDSAFEI